MKMLNTTSARIKTIMPVLNKLSNLSYSCYKDFYVEQLHKDSVSDAMIYYDSESNKLGIMPIEDYNQLSGDCYLINVLNYYTNIPKMIFITRTTDPSAFLWIQFYLGLAIVNGLESAVNEGSKFFKKWVDLVVQLEYKMFSNILKNIDEFNEEQALSKLF